MIELLGKLKATQLTWLPIRVKRRTGGLILALKHPQAV